MQKNTHTLEIAKEQMVFALLLFSYLVFTFFSFFFYLILLFVFFVLFLFLST